MASKTVMRPIPFLIFFHVGCHYTITRKRKVAAFASLFSQRSQYCICVLSKAFKGINFLNGSVFNKRIRILVSYFQYKRFGTFIHERPFDKQSRNFALLNNILPEYVQSAAIRRITRIFVLTETIHRIRLIHHSFNADNFNVFSSSNSSPNMYLL